LQSSEYAVAANGKQRPKKKKEMKRVDCKKAMRMRNEQLYKVWRYLPSAFWRGCGVSGLLAD